MASLRPAASSNGLPTGQDIDVDSPGEASGVQDQNQDQSSGNDEPSQSQGRTLNDLFNPPKDLAAMRQRLFEVKGRIELRVHEFERYWPYIDNVWVRQHKAGIDKTGRVITDYYACRLQRPTYTPKAETPRREGQPTRKKQIREGGTCQMRLKTIRYEGGYTGYAIVRIGEDTEHTHTLDHLDKIKRTSVMMEIARSEVMKGYMPASVFTVMNEDPEKLAAAGGRHLNRNDVRNASQHWRQDHRVELRVHEGYKYDHGNGIVREDDTAPHALNNLTSMVDPALTRMTSIPSDAFHFPEHCRSFLKSYLPADDLQLNSEGLPHVTLAYATSMDSCLSLAPGIRTTLSGPQSKAMTHYLRSKHDAIVVGVGTAIADNPALNCRLEGVGGYGGVGWDGQPRPVIIDPGARWLITPQSKILQVVEQGQGRAPWVVMAPGFQMDPRRLDILKYYGGKYLGLTEFDKKWRLRWEAILKALAAEGIKSVMIEGGGMVINGLLQPDNADLISSVIVTIAPTYLGKGGVSVSPAPKLDQTGKPHAALPRFRDVKWQSVGGDDVIFCGKMPYRQTDSQGQAPAPTAQMST